MAKWVFAREKLPGQCFTDHRHTGPAGDIDYGNSGTGLRLMMGLVAGHDMRVRFVGDPSLSRRPMGRILKPLMQMGLDVSERGRETLPLTIRGSADLLPIEYRTPIASAQINTNNSGTCHIIAGPFRNETNHHLYYLLSPATWTASEAFAEPLPA